MRSRSALPRRTRGSRWPSTSRTPVLRTYNDGLSRATGDYVVLLSADDMLAEGSLARAAALMEHDPTVGFVYGLTDKFGDRPRPRSSRVRNWGVWPGQDWYDGRVRRGTNPVLSLRS